MNQKIYVASDPQLSAVLEITAELCASAAGSSEDPDSSSESDSDSDGEDDDDDSPVSAALQAVYKSALECFIGVGGVRETHVKYARGEDGGRDYFLYVPPGGGKKLRSLREVQTYLDAPVEYSRTSPGLARPLPVVTGPGGEKRTGRVRTKSIMTMDAIETRPGGGALMYS